MLLDALTPGGTIIVSGILAAEEAAVRLAFSRVDTVRRQQEDAVRAQEPRSKHDVGPARCDQRRQHRLLLGRVLVGVEEDGVSKSDPNR